MSKNADNGDMIFKKKTGHILSEEPSRTEQV